MKLLYAFFYALIRVADKLRGGKIVPAPEASAGPSAEEAERLYGGLAQQKRYNRALSDRIDMKVKRAVRPATREEIQAQKDKNRAMALIRDAGGC